MGAQGLYLDHWTLYFNLKNVVPSIVPIWVKLPHLPLHYWDEDTLKNIKNSFRRYIDRAEPIDSMYALLGMCYILHTTMAVFCICFQWFMTSGFSQFAIFTCMVVLPMVL